MKTIIIILAVLVVAGCAGIFYKLDKGNDRPIAIYENEEQCKMELANNANTYCKGSKMFISGRQ